MPDLECKAKKRKRLAKRRDLYRKVGISSGNQALTRCAFLVTYLVRLPTTGLLDRNKFR